MSSSDLPKLWTELTKIGHIFSKKSTLKVKVFKNFTSENRSPSQIFFTGKKIRKIQVIFENDFERRKFANFERWFIILVGLMMTWSSENLLIFNICRPGLMPKMILKFGRYLLDRYLRKTVVISCLFASEPNA